MEVLLIDVSALGIFLGYMALTYWHGISHQSQSQGQPHTQLMGLRRAGGERWRAWLSGIARVHERGQLAHRSESPSADRN